MDRTEITENLFGAIDTIVSARMIDLNYDVTKICTITDDSLRQKKRYTVFDGSIEFEAYAQEKTLAIGDQVMVMIPNGDYDMQKLIIYKLENEVVQSSSYTTPLSQMQIFTDDILTFNEVEYGIGKNELLANDNDASSQVGPLFSIKNTDGNLNGYTRLGISADFQALLSGVEVVKGSYGLKIYVYTDLATAPGHRERDGKYEFTFSSNEMIGNPYAFGVPFTQEKVIDISYIDNINRIEIHFYQDGNFVDSEGYKVGWQQVNGNIVGLESCRLPNNLFVSNIKMYMGYNLDKFENNSLFISCKEPNTYHYSNYSLDSGKGPDKHLVLRWMHKFEGEELNLLNTSNEQSIEIDKQVQGHWQILNMRTLQQLGYQLKWYRYNIDADVVDEIAGRFWEEIKPNSANIFECAYMPRQSVQEERIKVIGYKTDITYESASTLINNADYLSNWNTIMNDNTLNEEQKTNQLEELKYQYLQAYESNTYFYSEEFILTNEVRVVDIATFDVSSQLSIYFEDGSEGNYFIYDPNGALINQGQGHGYERRMKAQFNGQDVTPTMGKLDWVAWYLPIPSLTAKTMLVNTEDYYTKDNGEIFAEQNAYNGINYICVRRYANVYGELNTYQSYSINDTWSNVYNNNMIRCELSIAGKVHTATQSMLFGKIGSNVSNTTLNIEMENNQNAIEIYNPDKEQAKEEAELEANKDSYVSESDYENAWNKLQVKWAELRKRKRNTKYIVTGTPYDIKGNKLSPKLGVWEWKWTTPMITTSAGIPYIELIQDEKNENQVELKANFDDLEDIKDAGYFGVLQATYTQLNETKLIAYLSVPLKKYGYTHIEGAQGINYSDTGSTAYYYPDAYRIFYSDENEAMPQEEYDGISWSILHDIDLSIKKDNNVYGDTRDSTTTTSKMATDYIPKLNRINRENKWYDALVAPSFYASGYDRICVQCKNANDEVIWVQPLSITKGSQNSASSGGWGGTVNTDDGTGTIVNTVLGSGQKNENNVFSGILMGDVQDSSDITGGSFAYAGTLTEEQFKEGTYYIKLEGKYQLATTYSPDLKYYSLKAATGLYGFQDGQISFSLKDNGVATFGKAGKGQIIIDGNNATLSSSGYLTSGDGMMIDLDDGKLQIREFNKLKFQLDVNSPYLQLSGKSVDNPMVYIGSNNCYLQSEARSMGGNGTYLDLVKGTFDIKGTGGSIVLSGDASKPFFEVKNNLNATLIHMDDDGYYLQSQLFESDSSIKLTKDSYQYEVYQQKPYILVKTVNPQNYKPNEYYNFINNEYILASGEFDETIDYYIPGNASFFLAFDKENIKIYQATQDSITKDFSTGNIIDLYEQSSDGIGLKYQIIRIITGQGKHEIQELDPDTGEVISTTIEYYDEAYFYTDESQAILDYLDREFVPVRQNAMPSGMRLDLTRGRIEGYNLKLIGTQVLNNKITNRLVINTEDATTPVRVGDGFYIQWDGTLACTKVSYISNTGKMPEVPAMTAAYDSNGQKVKIKTPIIELNGFTLYDDGTGDFNGTAGSAKTAQGLDDIDAVLEQWSGKNQYLTIENATEEYLNKSLAESLYLNKEDAKSMYIDQNYLNENYISKEILESQYMSKEECNNIIADLQNQINELKEKKDYDE